MNITTKTNQLKTSLRRSLNDGLSLPRISGLTQSIKEIEEIINIIIRNSEKQKELGTLSQKQNMLYEMIKQLKINLTDCFILQEDNKLDLYNFAENFSYRVNSENPQFENNDKIKELIKLCEEICSYLDPLFNSNTIKQIYYLLTDYTIGHSDYVILL